MRAVIQRVTRASVSVDGKITGEIANGFLILLGVHNDDTEYEADVLAGKISDMRIFTDDNDKMNLSLKDTGGSVLVISNFTLYADCKHGRRPSFFESARPEKAEPLYNYFCTKMRESGIDNVQKGIFGADMKVSLLNDGPVTIVLDTQELKNQSR
ncbi:MAG: D-aminoacyl-tRNA deacylase [Acutalibacteraceae bacterium]|nr:D-tyrosyl-tRNA(Tyr) deacylase [Clostridia bacterium]MBQ2605182.1 D-tyrosyl-tRNA(Tyr) deacylase [Clostridia bacterium]MEE3449429.1 D-aminoacyl-tRNA deacylase [Acutalibacteraceae bacterium]